eukprot:34156_1
MAFTAKQKNNAKDSTPETVKLTVNIVKINKKNKKQPRTFMLTDRAIYNINPKSCSLRRRIDLKDIASITMSSRSTEFTLNIPSQYDYRWDAGDKSVQRRIQTAICEQMNALNHTVIVNKINCETTSEWTVTKTILKKVNKSDTTLRTVAAVDHLTDMGFKRDTASNAFRKNNGNISLSIALISVHVNDVNHTCAVLCRSLYLSEPRTNHLHFSRWR